MHPYHGDGCLNLTGSLVRKACWIENDLGFDVGLGDNLLVRIGTNPRLRRRQKCPRAPAILSTNLRTATRPKP